MSKILLNRDNLHHNLNLIKQRVKSLDKIFAVLKDNAYGHGIEQISKLLKDYGIKGAIVRDMQEAELIKDRFESILILSDIKSRFATENISLTINSIKDFERLQNGSNIELKVDSGMHRNGIVAEELEIAFEHIKHKNLKLKGIFTHMRASDELSSEFFWQRKNFESIRIRAKELMNRYSITNVRFHSLNSAGIFRNHNFDDDDCVRAGIGIYGYLENDYLFENIGLKPVLSLWGDKVTSRVIKKAQRIGYGGTYQAQKDMIISTYDIGYSDFIRLNENHKYILPSGSQVLGRVSMDSMSVDSHLHSICIFDDVKELSKIFNTISYEILVKLSNKIERVVV